jgi:hemoglobin/transferrin/lactoferrin receptor protein
VFQFVNVGEVEIQGYEARLDARWPSGFSFTAAASTARGDQTVAGITLPLATIDPWKAVAGLRYDDPEGRLGTQLIVTHSAEKDASRVAASATCPGAASCFIPNGFTIVDATAYWNISDTATLRAGVFNIFDEKYAWWSDVRGLSATSTIADAYTQPGRNASVSLVYRF